MSLLPLLYSPTSKTQNPKPQNLLPNSAKPRKKTHKKTPITYTHTQSDKMKLENANKTQNPKPQNPLLNSAKPRKKTH
jgi:hypothetical protein